MYTHCLAANIIAALRSFKLASRFCAVSSHAALASMLALALAETSFSSPNRSMSVVGWPPFELELVELCVELEDDTGAGWSG